MPKKFIAVSSDKSWKMCFECPQGDVEQHIKNFFPDAQTDEWSLSFSYKDNCLFSFTVINGGLANFQSFDTQGDMGEEVILPEFPHEPLLNIFLSTKKNKTYDDLIFKRIIFNYFVGAMDDFG